ncbi:MAG: VCBS repeat-containing protein [Planctomycetes bacterium]|nr:VCBS repeat-containing protein [Planctomycetota bacterium]
MKESIVIILMFLASAFSVLADNGDEIVHPVGLDNFAVITVSPSTPLRIDAVKFIDLNNDGGKDILFTAMDNPSGQNSEAATSPYGIKKYAGILFQRNKSFNAVPDQLLEISSDACVLGCGDYQSVPGKELIFFTSTGVSYYPLNDSGTYDTAPKELLKMDTLFRQGDPDSISFSSVFGGVDVNNDGKDDIIIPEPDGYKLFMSWQNGFATYKIPLTPSEELKTSSSDFIRISNSLPNISMGDINGDGRKDVIIYNSATSSLDYYIQQLAGSNTPFTKGQFSLRFLQDVNQGKEIGVSSVYFCDINRDKMSDIVVAYTGGDLASEIVTRIFIFIAANGIYPETPSQIINLKGVCPLLRLKDFNGEGFPDLFLTSFETSFGSNLKKALLRYIPIRYSVYFSKGGRGFSVSPDYQRSINFPIQGVGKGTGYFSHIYLEYDFTGDGQADLVTISGPERKKGTLTVCPGTPRAELMKKNTIGFKKDEYLLYPVRIPDKALIDDLNNDGRCDILLQYKSYLTVLISR